MGKATQVEKILAYCAEHGSITAREVFINLNVNSPRKVISLLRKSGDYTVTALPETNGETRWMRYYIRKKETHGRLD